MVFLAQTTRRITDVPKLRIEYSSDNYHPKIRQKSVHNRRRGMSDSFTEKRHYNRTTESAIEQNQRFFFFFLNVKSKEETHALVL